MAGLDIESDWVQSGCYFHSTNVHIGARSFVNQGCHFENVERIEIGPNCALGCFVALLTSTHELGGHSRRQDSWSIKPVAVGAGCWIGVRATILPGVSIGDGCVIAAGATVATDCEPDGVYAGVPARRIRDLDDSGRQGL
jgi:acetyltransferase-like isoleucine patch superfamily enzyme